MTTQKNPYLVNNKLPEIATISYFDINEWNKDLTKEQLTQQWHIDSVYESEYQHRTLTGPQYGPGNEQSKETAKSVGKVGAKMAITTAASGALVAATGGLGAVVIGGLVVAEGYCVKKIGESINNDTVSLVGDLVFDTGIGTVTGGVFSTATTSLVSQGTKSIGHKAAQEIAKNGRQMTEGARLLISCGKTMAELANDLRMLEKAYDFGSATYEVTSYTYHGKHKDLGYDYKSDCPVCKGNF